MRWRAWCWDVERVTVHSSTEGAWQALPGEGVVGVVTYGEPPYRRILAGHDWVWMEDGELHATGTHPEWGEWLPAPDVGCAACLKRGAAVPDEVWVRIQREMTEARR